jgi:hypothetical protein
LWYDYTGSMSTTVIRVPFIISVPVVVRMPIEYRTIYGKSTIYSKSTTRGINTIYGTSTTRGMNTINISFFLLIMGILASRFTDITATAGKPVKGDVQINTSLPMIKSMKCVEVGNGKQKRDLLVMTFDYKTDYQPMGAKIEIKGELTYVADDPKKAFSMWSKDKTMEEKMSIGVINYLIKKCTIECIRVADDMDLPIPVKLPEIVAKPAK